MHFKSGTCEDVDILSAQPFRARHSLECARHAGLGIRLDLTAGICAKHFDHTIAQDLVAIVWPEL